MSSKTRKTRIICTLGPATDSDEMLKALIETGTNVFRLNMSHAKHDWVRDVCLRIRTISAEIGEHVAILLDLQGPSIRTGDVESPLELTKGDLVEFRKGDAVPSLELSTTVNYVGLMKDVSVGDRLIVDNGNLLMLIND